MCQKIATVMIFEPLHHRNCITQDGKILQKYCSLSSLQARQVSLKSEKFGLRTVVIWHGTTLS
jgi:hypothetical protein